MKTKPAANYQLLYPNGVCAAMWYRYVLDAVRRFYSFTRVVRTLFTGHVRRYGSTPRLFVSTRICNEVHDT
jgi:hypothetical protein